MPTIPYIPEYITVHLGRPDEEAENVTVAFPDYIKNVASSEIYPTWPTAALQANILAQTSFALNRIYTEWYRSRGYDFDITDNTAFDQRFINNRDIFDNISQLVDEQFNNYLRRDNNIEPLFAAYCDGVEVICEGLSQTGTVALAEQGYDPLQIIRYYYGDDVNIVTNVPVRSPEPSYPGTPLRRGDVGNEVQQLQVRLNRIARNYPAIPKITPVNGIFDQQTEDAVRTFQGVFGLTTDGIVGKATWYRILYIYSSVKRLAELDSEGLSASDIPQVYPGVLRKGDSGQYVRLLQYFIAVIGTFYDTVRPISIDGIFGQQTEDAVKDFQTQAGLTPDGVVGRQTARAIYETYLELYDTYSDTPPGQYIYPGELLKRGSEGESVRRLQTFLSRISQNLSEIPSITVDGVFGPRTEEAVRALQRLYGLEQTGTVDALTWNAAALLYYELIGGNTRQAGQFGGTIS